MQAKHRSLKKLKSNIHEIDLPKKILDVTKTVDDLSESILGREYIKDKNIRIKKRLLKAQGLYIDAKGNKKKISAIYAKAINLKDSPINNKISFPNLKLRDSILDEKFTLSNSERKTNISVKQIVTQKIPKQEFSLESLEKETTKSIKSYRTERNFDLVNSAMHEGDDYFYLDDSFTKIMRQTKKSFNKSKYNNIIGLNKTKSVSVNQRKEDNNQSINNCSNTSDLNYKDNLKNLKSQKSKISLKDLEEKSYLNETQKINIPLIENNSQFNIENENSNNNKRNGHILVLPKKSSIKNIKFCNIETEKQSNDNNILKLSNIKSMLNHQRNKDNGLIVKSGLHNQGERFLITSITTDNTSNRDEKKYPESSKNVLIDDYFTSDDNPFKNFKKTKTSSKNINVKFNLDMNLENDIKKELMKTQHISLRENYDFSPEKTKVNITDQSGIFSLKSNKFRSLNLPLKKLDDSHTSFLTTPNTHRILKSGKNSDKKFNPISLKINPKYPKKQLNNLINMCEALKVEDQNYYSQLEKELDIINPTIAYRNKISQQKVIEDDMFRPENMNKKYFVYGHNYGLFMSDVTSATHVLEEANVVSRIPPLGVYKFRKAICNRMGLNPIVDPETGELGLERMDKIDLDEEAKKFDYKFLDNHQKVNKVLNDIEKKHNYLMAAALSKLK